LRLFSTTAVASTGWVYAITLFMQCPRVVN